MPESKRGEWCQTLFTMLQAMVAVMTAAMLLFTFVGRGYAVKGTSMLPTLQDGEPLLIQHVAYTPAVGDVVVLAKASFREGETIVKRVIAVGGQTVAIDYAANAVYVDGEVLPEPYILEPMKPFPQEYLNYVEVPQGSIFVMGDNRNGSGDSRDPTLGVVDVRCVFGRVLFMD